MQEEVNGPPTPTTPYTACYCEENVYLLGEALRRLLPPSAKIFAVVISNPTKSIAVWQQLASQYSALDDFLVIWDYHVILCLKMPDMEDVWVYDADTRLGSPCKWDRYILETFKSNLVAPASDEPDGVPIPQSFRCMFRVVPVDDFLANFSSDRSHMVRLSPESGIEGYISPPPKHPPIVGSRAASSGKLNTLMDEWVDMTAEGEGHGLVLADYEFLKDTSWIERF